jgi:hypothetical protein
VDPIQDGRNWYAYCENNPLKFVDPTGHAASLTDALLAVWQFPQAIIGAFMGAASGIGLGAGLQPNSAKDGTIHLASPTKYHITMGYVMLHPHGAEMAPDKAAHEAVHQEQSRWLGPFYLPMTSIGYQIGTVEGTLDYLFNNPKGKDWVTAMHDASFLEKHAGVD